MLIVETRRKGTAHPTTEKASDVNARFVDLYFHSHGYAPYHHESTYFHLRRQIRS